MDEYITKKQVIEWFRCYAHEDRQIRFEDLEFDIQHMIPEDVAPVRHGRWIDRIDTDTHMHECSVCGARVVKGLYEYENPNRYCYHCGAKMDLEV